jgi:hypothetical protein
MRGRNQVHSLQGRLRPPFFFDQRLRLLFPGLGSAVGNLGVDRCGACQRGPAKRCCRCRGGLEWADRHPREHSQRMSAKLKCC